MQPNRGLGDEVEHTPSCTYENGELVFTDYNYSNAGAFRYYNLYYRDNDEIRLEASWLFFKATLDGGKKSWFTDEFTFSGLPKPESGSYTIHVGDNEYSTGLPQVVPQEQDFPTTIYDLQGRRMQAVPQRGVFIKDGKVSYK